MPAEWVTWPARAGVVPPLADCYTPRPESGLGYARRLDPGETTVLINGDEAGTGGSGKTQLAVGLAYALWQGRAVDLLVWVTASSREAVLTAFAEAIGAVSAAAADEDPEAGAARFLAWLAETSRPWLVVLDDLADPADLDGLWPQGDSGRMVITSGLPAATLSAPDRRIVPVGALTRREALSYLSARFNNDPDQRLGALDLAEDLRCVPLGLAQATAVMTDRGLTCRDYRARFAERRQHVTPAGTDDNSSTVAVTWSLCIDRADQLTPAGLAWPALALASLLDPAGIPGPVFVSRAAWDYITGHRGTPAPAGQDQVRAAVHNLAHLGLVTIDPASTARTVQVHSLVQAAIRTYLSAAELDQVAKAAADALLEAWPAGDAEPLVSQAFRDGTARLRDYTGETLWTPEAHQVLFRAGQSLDNVRLTRLAIAYWQALGDTSSRILGTSHAHTFAARDNLAAAHEKAGRQADAIPLYERTLQEREWAAGAEHASTLAARSQVGHAYLMAGRLDDGITVFQRLIKDQERLLGPDHADTLTARGNLAYAYRTAGRIKDAIPLYKRTLDDRERVQGPDHPDTLTARGNLASAYHSARRLKEAIPLYERNLAERERVQGPDHPDTLAARGNLASAYHNAGRIADAIQLYERAFADCERILGPDHPDTLTSRGNLASAYHTAGRLTDAVNILKRTLADCDRVLGSDHALTQTMDENLRAMQA